MDNQPLVTVLLPVYNGAQYITETLDSLLSQSFKDFEILLIDDCSTDNTEEIVKSIKDPRIKYLKNEKNLRLVATLNRGLDLINTKYIIRMDADDLSTDGRFQAQVDYMEANPEIGISSGDLELFGNESGSAVAPLGHDNIVGSLVFFAGINHAVAIYRNDFFKQNGVQYSEEHIYMEDYELWYRLRNKVVFGNIPKLLYRYRRDGTNSTIQNDDSKPKRFKVFYKNLFDDMGIDATDDDLQLHYDLSIGTVDVTRIELCHEWIKRLKRRNSEINFFPEAGLHWILNQRWTNLFFNSVTKTPGTFWKFIALDKAISPGKVYYYIKQLMAQHRD